MNNQWLHLFAMTIMALTTSLYAANQSEDALVDTVKDPAPIIKNEQNKQANKAQNPAKPEPDRSTQTKPVDDPAATAAKTADQPKIPKRDTGRFIPSESISEDLSVSFPVDI
jgi:phytoene/squalene synthetase